jgi:membrane-bound lytic murein transglycosylase D
MRNYPLRIPADRMDYFLENRESILENSASPIVKTESVRKVSYIETDKIYHKIKKGESLNMIASRYGVTTAQLKTWNNLSNNMIHAGRSLVIKRKNAADKQEVSENSPAKNVASSTETQKNSNATHHTVQSGESLTLIAKKYGISVAQLKQWNNLASEKIHPNTRLIVNESVAKATQKEQVKENIVLKSTTNISVSKVEQAKTTLVEKTTPTKESQSNLSATKTQTVNKKQHIVKQGETLWSIANHYNVPINTLKQINKIQDNKLKIGQVLILSL